MMMFSLLHAIRAAFAADIPLMPVFTSQNISGGAIGKSKRTVAQDQRRAAKVRARKRAKKLGHA